jgi:hypothetical protein
MLPGISPIALKSIAFALFGSPISAIVGPIREARLTVTVFTPLENDGGLLSRLVFNALTN